MAGEHHYVKSHRHPVLEAGYKVRFFLKKEKKKREEKEQRKKRTTTTTTSMIILSPLDLSALLVSAVLSPTAAAWSAFVRRQRGAENGEKEPARALESGVFVAFLREKRESRRWLLRASTALAAFFFHGSLFSRFFVPRSPH